ncbi:MAG: hypothetical protein EOR36_30600 [Mesorhizobium sp.]|nr:hypothetical protein EJ066_13105 [Mesorhizobium sp. M9A.F.Ca.ET.002.03.1.2]AZO25562.1 hypothetical protein EJ070_01280 [Mesorhizobium sp. M1E.F.Ca.ET.045.02.1.1]RWJ43628.1 MAG: hypothetical protein EOR29_17015 [Mesorhizobium sp.]TGQ36931.1 hypothetical protein EN859_020905 [Mesorhizobium sp. M00.F.Ca.ET.216.01.1.1]RWJ79390.1 MAG: hypothetical protein EOR36_30600 [Mesorhizobium sp.]
MGCGTDRCQEPLLFDRGAAHIRCHRPVRG